VSALKIGPLTDWVGIRISSEVTAFLPDLVAIEAMTYVRG